ncbi:MAG: cytidine deaminase [Anaerolineae bacterium]|nr:cytidine deaminase [Anaerolineae bacterium]
MNAESAVQHLLALAVEASNNAYIPYSNYPVGAALRALDGTIYSGCNVENASYPVTICAERTALVKAISEGRRAFDLIVVVTKNGGSPCGMCRQMLFEFSPHLRVITADMDGQIHIDAPLDSLLLNGFGPERLAR